MEFPIQTVLQGCAEQGIVLDRNAAERLQIYAEFLVQYNQKVNLTAITNPQEIAVKHFLDCLLFLRAVNPQPASRLIDVGTGAGFPGMILKIARPDLQITLLDSLQKRLTFLDELQTKLNLSVELVHERAEQGARLAAHRDQYDFATARAVAALPLLLEYCLPYVKPGGLFVSMKGPAVTDELPAGTAMAKRLGGGAPWCVPLQLQQEQRIFVLCEKQTPTPPQYPRSSAKLAKLAKAAKG